MTCAASAIPAPAPGGAQDPRKAPLTPEAGSEDREAILAELRRLLGGFKNRAHEAFDAGDVDALATASDLTTMTAIVLWRVTRGDLSEAEAADLVLELEQLGELVGLSGQPADASKNMRTSPTPNPAKPANMTGGEA